MTEPPPETSWPAPKMDLRAALRAMRRDADLSQRQLAARSGVPASTIARIESGAAHNPRFRTIERIVSAVGKQFMFTTEATAATANAAEIAVTTDPADTATGPHRHLRDLAERQYPAHLDVRAVTKASDWWGGWWADWYNLPRHRWPRAAPDYTFDLNRSARDRRRRRADRKRAARLRINLQPGDTGNVRRWVALDGDGGVVGMVGGAVCDSDRHGIEGKREFLVCDIQVAPAWRRLGLGTRLLEALHDGLAADGISSARVLLDGPDFIHGFFRASGFFHAIEPQPSWLVMVVRQLTWHRPGQPLSSQPRIR